MRLGAQSGVTKSQDARLVVGKEDLTSQMDQSTGVGSFVSLKVWQMDIQHPNVATFGRRGSWTTEEKGASEI